MGPWVNTVVAERYPAASHARAREDRVQVCMGIMRDLNWKRGETGPELAKVWECAATTVEDIAAEAWRRVKAEAQDIDRVKGTVCATLEASLEGAAAGREYRAVASLADVWTRITGARASEKHEHSVSLAASPEWAEIRDVIFQALAPHAAAREAVSQALAAYADAKGKHTP